MVQADQFEFNNALDTIDRITFNTQFGLKKILDGSQGASGAANGVGLEFLGASPATRSSPVEGYDVRIQQLGTKARVEGGTALTKEMIDAGEELTIAEGGKTVTFRTTPGDSVAQVGGKLKNEVKELGLDLDIELTDDNTFRLVHHKYGSEGKFSVASSSAGVLSKDAGVMESATPGRDIVGTIGGHVAMGKGQTLVGADGTPVSGLTVRYDGKVLTDADAGEGAASAGRVSVYQNSLVFQVGANVGQSVSVSLNGTNTRFLGRGVANESGFHSLRESNLLSAQKAQDTMRLLDSATDEVTKTRASLGAFQKNTLESNLQQLRITAENLVSAESTIRDTDMAAEIAEFTRNSIMVQSATAMLAQANATPRTVLTLIG
jgi:flagellin